MRTHWEEKKPGSTNKEYDSDDSGGMLSLYADINLQECAGGYERRQLGFLRQVSDLSSSVLAMLLQSGRNYLRREKKNITRTGSTGTDHQKHSRQKKKTAGIADRARLARKVWMMLKRQKHRPIQKKKNKNIGRGFYRDKKKSVTESESAGAFLRFFMFA